MLTLKRPSEEEGYGSNKKPKVSPKKCCTVCGTDGTVLQNSPESCHLFHHEPEERACGECWEGYLSMEVEKKRLVDKITQKHKLAEIQCMICTSLLPGEELKLLVRDGTWKRYEATVLGSLVQTCQARCEQSREVRKDGMPERNIANSSYVFKLQRHHRETDGRIFSCEYCNFATCVDCDRPEHCGESCTEYQHRTGILQELPMVIHKYKKDTIKPCPGCKVYWMLGDSGCGYVKCDACQHRFCSRCLVPWVGEGSAYLLGPKAHGIDPADYKPCAYGQRKNMKISKHALVKRYATNAEVKMLMADIAAAEATAVARESSDAAVGRSG
ncbi:hypothetical protein LTR42_003236 [Elasticomyces elasticus]|nr:hypothetical protein LTR42_003236 [Elasticomyces elasticus]